MALFRASLTGHQLLSAFGTRLLNALLAINSRAAFSISFQTVTALVIHFINGANIASSWFLLSAFCPQVSAAVLDPYPASIFWAKPPMRPWSGRGLRPPLPTKLLRQQSAIAPISAIVVAAMPVFRIFYLITFGHFCTPM